MARKKTPSLEHIRRAYEEALRRYSSMEYVTAIDTGCKYRNGIRTDDIAIRIHVRAMKTIDVFPTEIEGVPVDVIQAVYDPRAELDVSRSSSEANACSTQRRHGVHSCFSRHVRDSCP